MWETMNLNRLFGFSGHLFSFPRIGGQLTNETIANDPSQNNGSVSYGGWPRSQ